MREHWLSTTRKLNRHYQSGDRERVTGWKDFTLPIYHAGLAWGVDHNDGETWIGSAPLPNWARKAKKLELELFIDESNTGGSILYLSYIEIMITLYDSQGNISPLYKKNYWCQWTTPMPAPSSYTQLDDVQYTNIWGNPRRGEPFVYDPDTGLYKLRTTHLIIEPDLLDPTNTGVYQVGFQAHFGSTTTPQTAVFTRKVRLKKI